MQNKIIAVIAIMVGLGLGGSAILLWKMSQPDKPVAQLTKDNLSSGAASTLPATNNSSAGALSDNAQAQTQQGLGGSNQNQGQTNSQQSNSSEVTFDPTQFNRYDKYVNEKAAVYAPIGTANNVGAEAVSGKKVSVNYRGWLTNGKIFDENVDPKKPFSFTLGAGQVIPGWDQAVAGMKVGSERLIIIPPAVGYGPNGNGPIPGNAVLVFDVKLVAVE